VYIRTYSGEDHEDYTALSGLSFAPSADLVGASLPINEFQAHVHTEDDIATGQYAELYDDRDNLWARYWITYAEHENAQTVLLKAQSVIGLMDRVKLDAVYYEDEPIADVLDEVCVCNSGAVGLVMPLDYSLDSSFSSATVTGFCPEQTARERLLWVCFTLGAYVRTFFNDEIEILPIDDVSELIPMEDTYWKPAVNYTDWVTAVQAKYYSFTAGTPQTTDKYVTDAQGVNYIVTESDILLQNPYVPSGTPENMVTVEGVYLLNEDNVDGVLSHLAQWYFMRMSVDLDIINNAEHMPGDRVVVCADDETLVSGFMDSLDFSFGVQAKSRVHLTAAENINSGNLTVIYLWDTIQIGMRHYLFPGNYSYAITNPYIDMEMNGHRYVFRPVNEKAMGRIAAGDNTDEQICVVALDLCDGTLEIISVDAATASEGVVTIA